MGIRGLTTFIENRSHLYMEKYELYGTKIVIDGNSIACQLYKWHCKSNDCFGGDYDKFAEVTMNFFQILAECNLTAYVIFDGGYEHRKIATVISRMKNKIQSAEQLNSVTEDRLSVFPLFLRETFVNIALKLNIKCVRCDFESDTETASIARTLNCPVLSYDSDFFIFDVLYIPFSTFEMRIRKKKEPHSKETYNYIACEVYRLEKFLKSFGEMDKTNLPILAALLGNDYVKRCVFSTFYQNLKIQKCHGGQSDQQKRIKSLIIWLQNETVESALRKVLSRYKFGRRKRITEIIQNAIKGYNIVNSDYLKYLEITPVNSETSQTINLGYIDDIDKEFAEDDIDGNSSSSEDDKDEGANSSSDAELDFSKQSKQCRADVSITFLDNFRKCLYPPSFMDILTQHTYYCVPQVENSSLEHSHVISLEILSAIHKILTSSAENLICVARNEHGHVKKHLLPNCNIAVPSFIEIQNMSVECRKKILLKILSIDDNFVINCVSVFPESWRLFIIVIKYLSNKAGASWPLLYSLLICRIFLSHVDSHLGICRSAKLFDKKFGPIMQNVSNNDEVCKSLKCSIIESLQNISYRDSLICLQNFVSYFQINIKMRTSSRLFDRNLVHSMAQFQSCMLHIKYLNCLLNLPYPDFIMSDFYNGTFVYNLMSNFTKRDNLDSYIKVKLQKSETILNALTLIIDKIKEHSSDSVKCNCVPVRVPRKRRKKKVREDVGVNENEENTSEEEFVFDPNNKFSLLAIS